MLKFDIPNFDYCREHRCVFFVRPAIRPNFCMYFSQMCWTCVILMFVENMFFSSLLNYFKIASFDFSYLEFFFFKILQWTYVI